VKAPKWQKINGNEHTLSNGELQYDLLALEEFLNEMLSLGWQPILVSGGSRYTFVPCAPGEYRCRTVLAVTKNGVYDKKRAAELSELLFADGASIVEQRNTLGSQTGLIALRPASLGEFEIHSDIDSRIAEYSARKKHHEGLGITFFAIGMAYLSLSFAQENFASMSLFAVFFILAYYYWRPAGKYKEIIAKLRAQRDISET
jgi:hypothetical protein